MQSALVACLRDTTNREAILGRLHGALPPDREDGRLHSADSWARSITERGYPLEHLTRSVRSMGVKVGFVGPARGFGKPRFTLETPLLATLTRALVADDKSIPFGEFIIRARKELGLVMGSSGLGDLPPAVSAAFSSDVMARQQLRLLEERLRLRMIEAGLAREFSDAHTRVIGS